MTLVRERRQQPSLRLVLPPPIPPHRALKPSPLSSTTSSNSNSPLGTDSHSDLKKLCVLGRGNGGTVYKVLHNQTGAFYAFKVVRFGEDEKIPIHEAEILQRVDSSDYVVRCHGVFDSGFADVDDPGVGLCFTMEYMEFGSLNDLLLKKKRLSEQAISGVVRSVLKGLQYLHGMGVVHRDIKPSNLLVNGRGEVKIADFGASRGRSGKGTCSGSCRHENSCTGTCAYMSPERLDPENWDGDQCDGFIGDVWSLGVVALECYMGRFPFVGADEKPDWVTLVCAICLEENVESKLRMASKEFRSFCQRCLEKDWRKRGTVDEIIFHPFVIRSRINGGDDGWAC